MTVKKGGTFERYYDPSHPRHKRYIKRLSIILRKIKGPKVLDTICDDGLLCHLVSKLDDVEEVHGIDYSSTSLNAARFNNSNNKKVIIRKGIFEKIGIESKSFDTVVLHETLEHIPSVTETLKEAHRVLKKGGQIIITCPYRVNEPIHHVRNITKKFLEPRVSQFFNITRLEVIMYEGPGPLGLFCVGTKIRG